MCARYTISVPLEILGQKFNVRIPNQFYQSHSEAAPGRDLPVITNHEKDTFNFYRWGLIPNWTNDEKIGQKLFNARCETLMEKPAFASSFLARRCLVPADSFIEWHEVGAKKIPVSFSLNDNSPFAMAGIYDCWERGGKVINSFSIITCPANSLVERIHKRMPVILAIKDEKKWLAASTQEIITSGLLRPYPTSQMKFESLS